jgi:glucose/arabinose dehydrogenase
MLRIDVDRAAGGKPYAVPPDNPWVGDPAVLDEAWAIGLRNPWRYTFDPRGRLVVADVGQNAWEEVTFAPRGSNLGWKRMEGFECFPPGDACDKTGLQPPLWVYPHSEGNSITGGFVYTGQRIDALKGRYVFGDFGSGRLWALKLPASESDPATDVLALGRWQLNPSTFGRDADGELYVGDFGRGVVYALRP